MGDNKKNGRLTLFFIADYWGIREYFKRLIVRLRGIHSSYLIIMSLGNDYTKYCDIVESRWNFIQTESMGFAYSLSPSHADLMDKFGTDGIDTITQLRKDATKIFGTESGDKFNQELNGFLTVFTLLDTKRKNQFCELAPLHYWLIHGRIDFPMSAESAISFTTLPCRMQQAKGHGAVSTLYIQRSVPDLGMKKFENLFSSMLTTPCCFQKMIKITRVIILILTLNKTFFRNNTCFP